MNALERLFGTADRVKVLKLFLFNINDVFDKKDIIRRAKVSPNSARKEISVLESAGLIRKKTHHKEIKRKNGNMEKVKFSGFGVNESFRYIIPLQNLLIHSAPAQNEIVKKIARLGRVKLIVLSGIFLNDEEGRIDILIVGDDIKAGPLRSTISVMESELGKELRYAVFETADFKYRMSVYDRLVRDVLDFPHQVLIDKIGL